MKKTWKQLAEIGLAEERLRELIKGLNRSDLNMLVPNAVLVFKSDHTKLTVSMDLDDLFETEKEEGWERHPEVYIEFSYTQKQMGDL